MIDWTLDGFLPTRRQPAPRVETAADRDVLLARVAAAAIDLVLCYVLLEFPLIYAASVVLSGPYEALGGYVVFLSLVALLPLYVTYSFVCEWRYGRTPGKVNRGLLVVMADGRECTLRASAVRNLCRYVDLLGVPPLVLGLVSALVADGRRVGDLAAGTIVVRSTAPADLETAVAADTETSAAARASRDEKN
ncbi:RDD family protein [Natrinema thermotolerans]|uniref:RDD family protein n=1 Tax=Natrinema thermotolerans TaxID=121872 RepID=A0AAF0PJE0_9EURY|nr:RDD family protein [Natrinema thermotolerans]QCC58552.1 RDD family protein [Natrinema thermotolerans]WMT09688.1 RDD family protein [Natrinema thermotolerans]